MQGAQSYSEELAVKVGMLLLAQGLLVEFPPGMLHLTIEGQYALEWLRRTADDQD